MKRFLLLSFLCCFVAVLAGAQDWSQYQKHWLIQGADTLPYRVLLPANYDAAQKYPLLLFLHGGGERGHDNEKQLTHGAKLFLNDSVRKNFPAIVVFPQCPQESYWSNVVQWRNDSGKRTFHFIAEGAPTAAMRLLLQLVPLLKETYRLDEDRIYVGGLSMGGMGTFELVRRLPGTFAAAFPICGGAAPATAKVLKGVNWWVFHGAKDDVVPPQHSEAMVAALKKKKASVRFTLYPNANHNSWDAAFSEAGLLPWLFAQHN